MAREKENTETVKMAEAGWYTLETARAAAAPYKFRVAAEVFEPWDGCIMTGEGVNLVIKRAQAAIDAAVARIDAKRKELYGNRKEPLPIPRISVAQSIIDRREYKIQTSEHTFGRLKKYNVATLTQEMLTRFAQGDAEEIKSRNNARESAENETDNE